MAAQRGKQVESDESYKRRVRLYARAVPGMHRAGPGERGGGSYGRRAVAAAKGASMQISVDGKGLRSKGWGRCAGWVGAGLGGSKRNVYSIAVTSRVYQSSPCVPVASPMAPHTVPVLGTSRPSQWPPGPANFSHHSG